MKKEKIVLSISIGLTAFILTAVIFTQFKTVEQTDITAIETMREAELRTELSSWKSKYEEIDAKNKETQVKIDEYNKELSSADSAADLAKNEVREYEKFLGYSDVHGEGIIITLEDNDFKNIESYDLLQLVNELKLAGAEAIAINDERVVSTTDVSMVNGRIILVNTRRISGPYIVKAIGDKKYLESAITIKGGYYDEINNNEKTIRYDISDDIVIPKYEGTIQFSNAKIHEEEEN